MDRSTIEIYEQRGTDWERTRGAPGAEAMARAVRFARRVHEVRLAGTDGPVVDLGTGPGWFLAAIEPDAGDGPRRTPIGLDAAMTMSRMARDRSPDSPVLQADLTALPFSRGSLAAAWASKSYVHVARRDVPMALAELHHALAVGAPAHLVVFAGDDEFVHFAHDDFAGRSFSCWVPSHLEDVVVGAGFGLDSLEVTPRGGPGGGGRIDLDMTRMPSLPDTVGPGMTLLVCGLNPSPAAADAGVGFARPGNRFWPAALAAGIVTRDRDAVHALRAHGIGMTDLVKRPTARAAELTALEYSSGLERVERLVSWLEPRAVCFVGLAGWRSAVDRMASAGPQTASLGGRPVYVMPSTSGLNASSRQEDLTAHLRAAVELAG